jgi:hypothetical protein
MTGESVFEVGGKKRERLKKRKENLYRREKWRDLRLTESV